MSDLERRNTQLMISEARRFQAEVAELRKLVTAQDAKIASLTLEVANLKRDHVMASVHARVAETGHGGTA